MKHLLTNKKTAVIIVFLLVSAVLAIFIFLNRFNIKIFINETFYNSEITKLNLTTEQKLEDFAYLYEIITEHQPMLDDYKIRYGIGFAGNKAFYEELVSNTANDVEFYAVIEAIINDIPSCHTSLPYPDYDGLKETVCNNSLQILASKNFKSYTEYWLEIYKSYWRSLETVQATEFRYYDGKYMCNSQVWFEENYDLLFLTRINDIPVDEYIININSLGIYKYDYINQNIYKDSITITNAMGEKVVAEFERKNGEVFQQEVYILNKTSLVGNNLSDEAKTQYGELLLEGDIVNAYDGEEIPLSTGIVEVYNCYDFLAYIDTANGIGYVSIMNFKNENGEKLAESITKLVETENLEDIIIDISYNSGGNAYYYDQYVYQPLFTKTVTQYFTWYKHKHNDKTNEDFQIPFETNGKEYSMFTDKRTYIGKAAKEKNIYLIISGLTGSAADSFAAIVKDNDLATIIGTNTNGEGYTDTFYMDMMPNSHLSFYYMGSKALNSDGTDNSVYGTAPDIYINTSPEAIYERSLLIAAGYKVYRYDHRILWDNVLAETIDIIRQSKR